MDAATDGAVYRRDDGIVLIDPEKAEGRRALSTPVPYRVIYWNEEKQIPQKCTLCAHLLDEGWKEPRCVEACPTGALVFGDLDDPQSDVNSMANLEETGRAPSGIQPRIPACLYRFSEKIHCR